MRRIREVLRYRFECKMSLDRIADALGISKGFVHGLLEKFEASGLHWPLDAATTDSQLEEQVYGKAGQNALPMPQGVDAEYLRSELSRKHVTKQLLWREFQEGYPDDMSRATFFRRCKEAEPVKTDLKMIFKGGDKLLVDYSGDGISYIDKSTGEIIELELFVACWGASSYSYAEATLSQKAGSFCASHVNAFEYFGCIPFAIIPDNLRSGISKSDRYEPRISPLYEKLAEHYAIAILPARVREPKDKAGVESGVGFVQRYILGRLRNRKFFSLHEVNTAIREELEQLNNELMQQYGEQSRRVRFEMLDKPNAQPLPSERFIMADAKFDVGVAPNYHVRYEDHFYSVPHALARQKVDLYLVGSTLEIYQGGVHLYRHLKQPGNFGYTTIDEHMPPNHRFVRGWSVEWFMDRASTIGPAAAEAIAEIMKRHRHPQQGFNSSLGVLNLVKQYTAARVEAACRRAVFFHCYSYQGIKSILNQKLDEKGLDATLPPSAPAVEHVNVRGSDYFDPMNASAVDGEDYHAS